jgi:hypothetical protein
VSETKELKQRDGQKKSRIDQVSFGKSRLTRAFLSARNCRWPVYPTGFNSKATWFWI